MEKIKKIEELAEILKTLRGQGKKIVHCHGVFDPLSYNLLEKLGCSRLVITRGKMGCAVYSKNKGFVKVPSFAQKIVDRVGAGDAFLSVTALASVMELDDELLGFLGNVVGSLAVEILGNKKSIDKLSVQKYIVSLMK